MTHLTSRYEVTFNVTAFRPYPSLFQHYAQYVISVMAKLCAPVRDEKIKQLTETVDVIDTFKGILEVCSEHSCKSPLYIFISRHWT